MAESVSDDDTGMTPGYKAPEKKSVQDILQTDADDESLRRYKQQLLGDAATLQGDGPEVVVQKLHVVVEGHEDICLDLTGDLTKLKSTPIVLKEGCEYKLKVTFKVTAQLVCGLRLLTKISRKGIKVESYKYMVGSHAAKVESSEWTGPVEEAPNGMIARGTYDCESRFTDDDMNDILKWNWTLEIKKHWPEEKKAKK